MNLLASEEYGLRCLLRVAGSDGAPIAISEIAEAEGLSCEYAAKLLRQMRVGGLVTSVRGADGGYRLARPARQISVWSAISVLGGEFFPEGFCACHPGRRALCVRTTDCSLRALWRTVQRSLRNALEAVSLADLARDERAMTVWLDGADTPTAPIRL